jgi:hypothetical protein
MKARTTAVLAAIAVVVLALGLYFGVTPREQLSDAPPGRPTFPDLTATLQGAATIEVLHHGDTVRVVRQGDIWVLPARDSYPAQQGRVHQLLAALSELKLQEPRTSNPDDYGKLGVEGATSKDATSTEVRVLDGKGAAVADLIVGHQRGGSGGEGDGVYVRKPAEAQAWLAAGSLAVETDPQQWIDQDIVNISHEKIASITVVRDGAPMEFARADDKVHIVKPADHPRLDQVKLDEMARALEDLTLTAVKRRPAPGDTLGVADLTTTDGMKVAVTVSKSGPDIWVQLAATGEGKAEKDAQALDAKVKDWAYQVGAWKELSLVPSMDELKLPEQPPAAAPAPPPAVQAAPAAKPDK